MISKTFEIGKIASISALIGFTFFCSCEQTIKFEQAQPINVPDLVNGIPKELVGEYYSAGDSSTLIITDTMIVTLRKVMVKLSKAELDSTVLLKGDTVIDLATGFREKALVIEDSLILSWPLWSDTLYGPDERFKLRKFKGHYFLNRKLNEKSWIVNLLEPHKKHEIAIEELKEPDDISLLGEITEVKEFKADSTARPTYTIDPTQRELKKLMKRGFKTKAIYRKVR